MRFGKAFPTSDLELVDDRTDFQSVDQALLVFGFPDGVLRASSLNRAFGVVPRRIPPLDKGCKVTPE
jgi:hypothetical protein